MSLQFILGGSGTGKSERLYQMVIERAMAYPDEKILMIVPEQYTMQTQKHIVEAHPRHGVMNVDILSFERLAWRVFDELGLNQNEIIEDTGKRMIIRRLLAEHREELYAFRGNIKKPGFVEQVKSMLSELLQYRITPELLEQKRTDLGNETALYVKLQDIGLIYRSFMQFINERYLTTEEVLDRLCDVIERSELVRHSMIFMDDFTGFTPIQYRLMTHLLNLSPGVVLALPVDISAHPYQKADIGELFSLTRDTIVQLERICWDYRIRRDRDILLADSAAGRFAGSPELAVLEKNLFREQADAYDGDLQDVQFYQLLEPKKEMQFVAARIHEYVAGGQYRYDEIAVVAGDMSPYRSSAQYWFDKYGIPCFFDGRRNVSGNMLIEWMRAMLNMFIRGFSYESVFRYLRCGLSGITMSEADRLEDYVLAMGIRGFGRWQQVWTERPLNMDEAMLAELNAVRERFISLLAELYEVVRNKDAKAVDYIRAMYRYMCRLAIRQQLDRQRDYFEQMGDLARAREYEQIYHVVLELLEEMSLILGQENMTVRELSEVLEAGLSDIKLAIIPPGMDQVTFGDIRRTRLDHIRILFFVGMNDGLVPLVESGGGLLTDRERDTLAGYELKLAPTARENTCTEYFYLYASMTKPSDKLILSWSAQDASGHELRPSAVLDDIRKVFPKMHICRMMQEHMLAARPDVHQGYQYMLQGLRGIVENGQADEIWYAVYDWFHHHCAYRDRTAQLVDAAFYQHDNEILSRAALQAVYGGQLTGGVTMLEKYAACAYAHFLTYGLRLRERQIYQVQAPDIGMIFHQAIERFSMRIGHSGYQWRDIPDELRDRMAEDCVRSVTMEYNHSVMQDSMRAGYLTEKIIRMTKRTVWALQQQLKKGDFDPVGYELRFTTELETGSMRIVCGEDGTLALNGKIDRMDTCEADGRLYLRIIDYKSGNTAFDLSSVYYGLQLQLMVYMNAACELERRKDSERMVIPAGVLYYHIDDPLIQTEEFDTFMKQTISDVQAGSEGENVSGGQIASDVQTVSDEDMLILNSLTMNGLVVDDADVLQHMDRYPDESPKVFPITYKKDGTLSALSSAVVPEKFEVLAWHVRKQTEDLSRRIFSGDIAVRPYSYGQRTACDYCSFKAVCGFDSSISGYAYNRMRKLKKDEVWTKIGEEAGQWDSTGRKNSGRS